MLEAYLSRVEVIDDIRGSWAGEVIERAVAWFHERNYSRSVVRERICMMRHFAAFAWKRGARRHREMPAHVAPFLEALVAEKQQAGFSKHTIRSADSNARIALEIMLRDFGTISLRRRGRKKVDPFNAQTPKFFDHLREERALSSHTIRLYVRCLRRFEEYLEEIGLAKLEDLSPQVLASFVTDGCARWTRSDVRAASAPLRVFLRYIHRHGLIARDLSSAVEFPQQFGQSSIPRSIGWGEVKTVLDAIDRRTKVGKRDYAMVLLLVTYGLRAREVARLTLDDIDWHNDRLRVPGRKAGHSAAFPLSAIIGAALLDYLQHARPESSSRHLFLGAVAPYRPCEFYVVSQRASRLLRRAGIQIRRAGSHTFRHTCVQRLVDANFSLKQIGDYIGHSSPSSTRIYSKIAVDRLREIAMGDLEEML